MMDKWNKYSRAIDIIGSILIPEGYMVEVTPITSHRFEVEFKKDTEWEG